MASVGFYMVPTDRAAFLVYVMSRYGVTLLTAQTLTPEVAILSPDELVVTQPYRVYLWASAWGWANFHMAPIVAGGYYLDGGRGAVLLDYRTCRLWGSFLNSGSIQLESVPDELRAEGARWFRRIEAWLKRSAVGCDEQGNLILPGAHRWTAETGGKLRTVWV